MNGYILTFYILFLIGLLIEAYNHGKPKEKHNLWIKLVGTGMSLFLLWGATGWVMW